MVRIMNKLLDISKWQLFPLSKVFDRIEDTKGGTTYELVDGADIPYIAAKKSNNGVMYMVDREGNEAFISKGNCIVFILLGDGSGGYSIYQPSDFIGMKGKTKCGYSSHLNKYNALFIVTVLDKGRYKYSFGRSWTGKRFESTEILLPATIDNKPDWEAMEEYVKYHSNITISKIDTKIKSHDREILNTLEWKEFPISKIFNIKNGCGITKEEISENTGYFVAVQSGEENNGIIGMIDYDYCVSKNYVVSTKPCLTVARSGSSGYISYQPNGCVVGDSAKLLLLKEESHANKYVYLFLKTILMAVKYKYCYGRKVTEQKYGNEIIRLPITDDGEPDWQYMEDYIKSIPYGDRI